jgi:hypothetical protein
VERLARRAASWSVVYDGPSMGKGWCERLRCMECEGGDGAECVVLTSSAPGKLEPGAAAERVWRGWGGWVKAFGWGVKTGSVAPVVPSAVEFSSSVEGLSSEEAAGGGLSSS